MRTKTMATIMVVAIFVLIVNILVALWAGPSVSQAVAGTGVQMYRVSQTHWIATSQLKSVDVQANPSVPGDWQMVVKSLGEGDFVVFTGTQQECLDRVFRYVLGPPQQSLAFVD